MKNVAHICQRQKGLEGGLKMFSPRFLPPLPEQIITLSCSRWNVGRKVKVKVLVSDGGEKAS
jgi:hypothetical protein